jgi:hypothetical protein
MLISTTVAHLYGYPGSSGRGSGGSGGMSYIAAYSEGLLPVSTHCVTYIA